LAVGPPVIFPSIKTAPFSTTTLAIYRNDDNPLYDNIITKTMTDA